MISGAGIFACTSCGEMIYSDARTCRFCFAPVDSEAAALGAKLQAQVNTACNQAKMLRQVAGAMWLFLLVSFVAGNVELVFHGLVVFIPLSLIFWQLSFGKLKTSDLDYKRAKRDHVIALVIWFPAPLVEVIVYLLLS